MDREHLISYEPQSERRATLGRPRLNRPRRVRITTTVEPSKLALLRKHAHRMKKSLGQLADEYVDRRFSSGTNDVAT